MSVIKGSCLCESARRLSRNLTAIYQDKLAEGGLSPSQFILLRTIQLCQPILVSTLAEAVELDQSTTTRNLALLKDMNAINIDKGDDGRTRVVRLSARGQRLVSKAIPLWEEAQQEAKQVVGPLMAELLLAF